LQVAIIYYPIKSN